MGLIVNTFKLVKHYYDISHRMDSHQPKGLSNRFAECVACLVFFLQWLYEMVCCLGNTEMGFVIILSLYFICIIFFSPFLYRF